MTIRNPLTKDEVQAAMSALASEGLPLSLRGLLERCGRGSLSTIARFKAEIQAEEAAHAAEAPTIAPALQPIFALDPKLYARLMDAARNEVHQETVARQARCASLEADQAALVSANAGLEEQVARLTSELAMANGNLVAETARREAVQAEYHQAAIRWADRMQDIGERLAAVDEVKQHLHAVAINQSRITVAVDAIPERLEQLETHTVKQVAEQVSALADHHHAAVNAHQQRIDEVQIVFTREAQHLQAVVASRLGRVDRALNGVRHCLNQAVAWEK